jgi:hypothetical protein
MNPVATAPVPDHSDEPVIENEIPAYRAFSPSAIVSAILGAASVLCFADPAFYVLPVLAIVLAFWATHQIRKYSDVLTGLKFAQAGIVLAVLFGISSITITLVQSQLRAQGARAFAKVFEKTLNSGRLADAVWYRLPPDSRRGINPQEALESFTSQRRGPNGEESAAPNLVSLVKYLSGPQKRQVEFVEVEIHGLDRLTPYALAVYKISGEPDPKAPKAKYCAITMKAMAGDVKKSAWYVEDVQWPYEPQSFKLKEAPIDDGHGHAGGH